MPEKNNVKETGIKYKTRGNSAPDGKPKVYFSCHPEDFERCFNIVTEDILKLRDCAIYYYTPSDTPEKEIVEAEILTMQLVVVPVTFKYLCGENRAFNEEFRLAREHRIPILPLMQERNLAELFNQRCGELQFLDKYDEDATAIPFGEKLSVFLDTVLISDEIINGIKNAFDAYVFLSYRKKDRKYIRDLMKKIHKNDSCRDFAIWYDEFLVPGENFNESIIIAMKKSKLFVLVVTPNLVNENNYVVTDEYPKAKELSMQIFPVEVDETDKEKLKKLFEDVPDCTAIEDEQKFFELLTGFAEGMVEGEKNDSPEHKYYIGLAYLSGIDVETDSEMALSLLEDSANEGFCRALEKLVDIYSTGIGVDCNADAAISWQKKLIDVLEGEKQDCEALTAKQKLSELYLSTGRFVEALALTDELIGIIKKSDVKDSFIKDVYKIACLTRYNTHEYADVIKYAEECIGRLDKADFSELILFYNFLGATYGNLREYKKAADYLDKLIKYYRGLKEKKEPDLVMLATVLGNMGTVRYSEGELGDAESFCVEAVGIMEELERYDRNYCYNSVKFLNTLAIIREDDGDYNKAERTQLEALDKIESLCRDEADLFNPTLAKTYENTGGFYINMYMKSFDKKILRKGGEYVEKAAFIYKVLSAKNFDVYQEHQASCLDKLSIVFSSKGNMKKAKKISFEALEIREKLYQKNPAAYGRALVINYNNLAILHSHKSKFNQTEFEYLEKAIEIGEKLYMECPEDMAVIFAEHCQNFGRAYEKKGDLDMAMKYYDRIKTVIESMPEKDSGEGRVLLSAHYNYMAGILHDKKEYKKAEEYFLEAIKIREELYEKNPEEERLNLGVSYNDLGWLYFERGKYKKAEDMYEKAAQLFEVLCRTDLEYFRGDLELCYSKLFEIYQELDEQDKLVGICIKLKMLMK